MIKEFYENYEEIEKLVDKLADDIINNLDKKMIKKLKRRPKYDHFGFGLYIRNNYIYNNEQIKYMIEADDLSSEIYDRIIEKLSNNYK